MQLDASYLALNSGKRWNSEHSHVQQSVPRMISKTLKKQYKTKSFKSEAKHENKNNEWSKKFNNHQLYLKLMEIDACKKHKQFLLHTQDEAKARMMHNMEMARKRRQIEISIQNGEIARRIEQASERTAISQLFGDHKSYQSLPKKKIKQKKHKKKTSSVQLPSIRYVYNS